MRTSGPSALRPMRLRRFPEPFHHRDWLYEVKFDGFRALAHVTGHHCQLVSRNGNHFKSWPYLAEEIAHAVRAHSAVLDGEIVCLDAAGCSRFYDLMFRREWPYSLAFDVLSIDGDDLRALPLVHRKRRLARIMPRVESRLMFLDSIPARGRRLFELACERDLEGIVAKWSKGTYQCDGRGTSWLKIKNPEYSQAEGRHDLLPFGKCSWKVSGNVWVNLRDRPCASPRSRRWAVDANRGKMLAHSPSAPGLPLELSP